LYIFDFDGVIANSLATCRAACVEAAALQGSQIDLALNPFAELDPLTFDALARSLDLNPTRFVEDLGQFLLSRDPVPVVAGMAEVIRQVAGTQPISVLSASPVDVIRRFLVAEGLADEIRSIVGGDGGGSKVEHLRHFARTSPHAPLVMVGDAVSDVLAAQGAAVPFVGVAWGWQSARRLAEAGAGSIADQPKDLPGLLAQAMTEGPR